MASPARTVVLDEPARDAVDSALQKWTGAELAWSAIEWTLAHDPLVGAALIEAGNVRALIYNGAHSIDQPDVEVIYEIETDAVIVRSAVFSDPKASQAGRA
jgi:hypothetical protein